MSIGLQVNGDRVELHVPGMRRLLDVLREDLGLTGTKEGCGEGECGACSVLLDGAVVDACLVPICQVEGAASVITVEGLARDGERPQRRCSRHSWRPAGPNAASARPACSWRREAFIDAGAEPTDDGIRQAIAGNLCRCTGYTKIIDAIALASRRVAGVVE